MSIRRHIDGLFEWGPKNDYNGEAGDLDSTNVSRIAAALFGPAQTKFIDAIEAKLKELGAADVQRQRDGVTWSFTHAGTPCRITLSGNQRSLVITQPSVPGSYCVDIAVALKKIAKAVQPPKPPRIVKPKPVALEKSDTWKPKSRQFGFRDDA